MKRSKNINIENMRGFAQRRVRVKPLAFAIAAATLVACSSREPVVVYENAAQCAAQNPGRDAECEAAYTQAAETAVASGPKYNSLADCRAEFGAQNCVAQEGPSGQSWFMPAMAGFMLGQALDGGGRRYQSAPLYTSYASRSPAYGRWTTVDGTSYGSRNNRTFKADKDAFKPKPAVTRTMSRGGFGSTVAAKSNWGGSQGRRSGGWGG